MNEYQNKLKLKMNEYALGAYRVSKVFPKEEIYGLTSQLRRSVLSVILNYIEGYARRKILVRLNFLEISYGSLNESKYLIFFANQENYINQDDYQMLITRANEIGAMLWKEIDNISQSC